MLFCRRGSARVVRQMMALKRIGLGPWCVWEGGGGEYRRSILRNDNVLCLGHLFLPMSHVG